MSPDPSNVTRGRLAEYLVSRALGLGETSVRNDWDAWDLTTKTGVKVEVKSAAYIQSWHQNKLSPIQFVVPKTRAWDPLTNQMEAEARRQADVYVFALLAHQKQDTLDALDVSQWRFYVVPTGKLDNRSRSQHSITLRSLEALTEASVGFGELRQEVERVAAEQAGAAPQDMTASPK